MKDERKRASINVNDKTLAKLDAFRKNHENEYPWRQSLVDRIFEDWLNQQSGYNSILESAERISTGKTDFNDAKDYKQYVVDNSERKDRDRLDGLQETERIKTIEIEERERIKTVEIATREHNVTVEEEKRQKIKDQGERIKTEEEAKRKRFRGQGYQKPSVSYDGGQGCPPEF